jgi:CheY-like chemotaxis protein
MKTYFAVKWPADQITAEHITTLFHRAGVRQQVSVSTRLVEQFALGQDVDQPAWYDLAWVVGRILSRVQPAYKALSPNGAVLIAEYLSFPAHSAEPANRRIAVISKDSLFVQVMLADELQETPITKPTVLLVEDDVEVSRATLMLIRKLGAEGVHSSDGHSGLVLAGELIPDVIITDVSMPGMDGLELSRQLKADPATAGIPILVWSGDSEYRQQAMAAGALQFFNKPADVGLLIKCLRNLVKL